jgi:hypothetical protein
MSSPSAAWWLISRQWAFRLRRVMKKAPAARIADYHR